MSEFFWGKLLQNKWSLSIIFVGLETFCWKNWNQKKKRKKLWWCPRNMWMNIKKLHAWNNIFNKEFQIWDFESFIFRSNFPFLGGNLIGHFSQCVLFSIFYRQPTMVGNIFTQPSHHKNASYGSELSIWNVIIQRWTHLNG